MLGIETPILVALILSAGGFFTAIASGVFGLVSSRKTRAERVEAEAHRETSVIDLAQNVLAKTIKTQREELDRQDEEIAALRIEVRHLNAEVRKLELEIKKQRGT